MNLRLSTLMLLIAVLWPTASFGEQGVVVRYVPQFELVGSGRLRVLFWDVYDAALYAPKGRWEPTRPYALVITYLRSLKGADIAERSTDEIREQGFTDEAKLNAWYRQMLGIFPDVEEGMMITGVRDEDGRTLFYKKDMRIGIIDDPEFAQWFFAIWLDEKTPEPRLRNDLLGLPNR